MELRSESRYLWQFGSASRLGFVSRWQSALALRSLFELRLRLRSESRSRLQSPWRSELRLQLLSASRSKSL